MSDPLVSRRQLSRLYAAIAASAALHAGLIFFIQGGPRAFPSPAHPVISARLEPLLPDSEVVSPQAPALARADAAAMHTQPAPVPRAAKLPGPVRSSAAPEISPAVVPHEPTQQLPVISDPTYYPAGQLDVLPRALAAVTPAFPQRAQAESVDVGEVTVLLLIDETGEVTETSVVTAKPEGYFEESTLAALRGLRFAAGQKNGRNVKSRVLVKINYSAEAKAPAGR